MKKILEEFKSGRREFDHGHLEGFEGTDPFVLFELWMKEAVQMKENEPNAFVLSSVSESGRPSSRIVYLKDMIDGSFVWYTNYNSKKAKEIQRNNHVSMLFFWPNASRQIRIEGTCTKVSAEISDAYFESRPRASKIGAWASDQSEDLSTRGDLDKKVQELSEKFDMDIPRPEFWGGFGIKPDYFEFWQGRPSRLHDRLVFESKGAEWKIRRLNP